MSYFSAFKSFGRILEDSVARIERKSAKEGQQARDEVELIRKDETIRNQIREEARASVIASITKSAKKREKLLAKANKRNPEIVALLNGTTNK